MAAIDPRILADRLLHGIDPDELSAGLRVRLAAAYAELAAAEEAHTGNLLRALAHAGELPPAARGILVALIRRRLGVIPPDTDDGRAENGGR